MEELCSEDSYPVINLHMYGNNFFMCVYLSLSSTLRLVGASLHMPVVRVLYVYILVE